MVNFKCRSQKSLRLTDLAETQCHYPMKWLNFVYAVMTILIKTPPNLIRKEAEITFQ